MVSLGSFNDVTISESSSVFSSAIKKKEKVSNGNDDVSSVSSDASDVGVIKAPIAMEKEKKKTKSKFYTAGKIKENGDESDFEEDDDASDYKGSHH